MVQVLVDTTTRYVAAYGVFPSGVAPSGMTIMTVAPADESLLTAPGQKQMSVGGVLSVVAIGAVTPPVSPGFTNPMTTLGDLIIGSTGGAPSRMPKGGNSAVFGIDSGGSMGYIPMGAVGFPNPMTTVDDIIRASAAGAPIRQAKGPANSFWGVNASNILNYYQLASTAENQAGGGATTTSGTPVAISAAPSFVGTGRYVDVHCFCRGRNNVAAYYTQVYLFMNGSTLAEVGTFVSSTPNDYWTMFRTFRVLATAGTSYQFQLYGNVSGGTGIFEVLGIKLNEIMS